MVSITPHAYYNIKTGRAWAYVRCPDGIYVAKWNGGKIKAERLGDNEPRLHSEVRERARRWYTTRRGWRDLESGTARLGWQPVGDYATPLDLYGAIADSINKTRALRKLFEA
jgi:hypothetical protein